MMNWKTINNYFGEYKVSETGLIKSFKTNKILKVFNGSGYDKITLCKNGKTKKYFIHRLIAEHFIPNPDTLPTVNHKNGDKKDNRLFNLEWSSYKQQELHKKREIQGNKRGVFTNTGGRTWYSRIKNEDRYQYLGSFSTKEEAEDIFYNKYIEIYGVKPW